MEHFIKISEDYATAISEGIKPFEVRYNDRNYQKGDILRFKVVARDGDRHLHTHDLNYRSYIITNVHSGIGMEKGYVVLGIKKVTD